MKKLSVLALSVILTACGGGGSSSSPTPTTPTTPSTPTPAPDPVQPVGIYTGTSSNDTGNYEIAALISPDGEIRLIVDDGTQYTANMTIDGSTFAAETVLGFDFYGELFATGSASGTFTDDTITGETFVNDVKVDDFTATKDDQTDDGADLATITGNYSTFNGAASFGLDSDGHYTGSNTDGCIFEGDITVIDSDVNVYRAEMDVTSCGEYSGHYNGLATYAFLFDDDESRSLVIQLDNGIYSISDALYK
ncbi:hypothetical protein [Neptunicella sp. SCSIO 80796]|uniref:hypothetical protein n=1 Tax=Neptunicella plasticusilytica TaxID=3117012 RepID=UPI003A4D43DB